MNREEFLVFISDSENTLPMKLSTIVYLVNLVEVKNKELLKNTPKLLLDKYQNN